MRNRTRRRHAGRRLAAVGAAGRLVEAVFVAAGVAADGVTVTVFWSAPVTGTDGLALDVPGAGFVALAYKSGSGTAEYALEATGYTVRAADFGVTLFYAPGNLVPVDAFSGFPVTNNSVQP